VTTSANVVTALMDACNRKDLEAALRLFADDAVYHNIPLAPAVGLTAIRETLGPFLAMADEVDWITHHIAANDQGVVMTERTDRFHLPSGWLEVPVMGIFEVRDGKIAAWRDYFDMVPLKSVLGL